MSKIGPSSYLLTSAACLAMVIATSKSRFFKSAVSRIVHASSLSNSALVLLHFAELLRQRACLGAVLLLRRQNAELGVGRREPIVVRDSPCR